MSKFKLLGCLLVSVGLPAAAMAYYLSLFGVNVITWDEWMIAPYLERLWTGHLSLGDLFSQFTDNRIPFPKLAMLLIESLTRFNTVAEMFFGWACLSASTLLIFYVHRRSWLGSSYRLALTFLPVSLLLFNFRQGVGGILLGLCAVTWGLLVLGVVGAFTLLWLSKRTVDGYFLAALGSGVLATYSLIAGLFVWPIGVLQLLYLSEQGRNPRKLSLWCLVGALVSSTYLYGWSPYSRTPLDALLGNPVGVGMYFFAFLASPFSWGFTTFVPVADVFGLVMVSVALFVLIQGAKRGVLRRNGVWVSFIIFTALFAFATTYACAARGWGAFSAFAPRYVPVTSLGIAGLYLLAVSLSGRPSVNRRNFRAYALLALLLAGLTIGYGSGWQDGVATMSPGKMATYVLRTYSIQSEENLITYLQSYPPHIQRFAPFVRQERMNVFSEPQIDPSTLIPAGSATSFSLDTVNGFALSQLRSPLGINSTQQATITITGWAVDMRADSVASAVFLRIDGRDIPTLYGLDRPDVSSALNNPNFRYSGFMASFSSRILSEGVHTISLIVVGHNATYFYYEPVITDLKIVK